MRERDFLRILGVLTFGLLGLLFVALEHRSTVTLPPGVCHKDDIAIVTNGGKPSVWMCATAGTWEAEGVK
jgi:hypothetical protein